MFHTRKCSCTKMSADSMPPNGLKDIYTLERFITDHHLQLQKAFVPQLYWETLFHKLKNEVFDAGVVFEVQCVQTEETDEEEEGGEAAHTWRVVVSNEDGIQCADPRHIYLIDHAWTYRAHEARKYLCEVPGLMERMAALMEVETEDRDNKSICDDILTEMWRFNQTYNIGNFALGTQERLPLWYIMDEFGSRIQHSDTPTCRTVPLMYGPQGIAYTLLWPVKDLEEGDEVCRDFAEGIQDVEERKALLLPWVTCDLKYLSFQQSEPGPDVFTDGTSLTSDLSELSKLQARLPTDRKLKVFIKYPDRPELTDDRFEVVEDMPQADIVWLSQGIKDFNELTSEESQVFISQFPHEQCITVKDLLVATCRRAGTGQIDPDTLEGSPRWLPVTYNLKTELTQFVSYFQHRQAKGLDNVWIIKPWNMSNSLDICVTDNLNQIIRVRETGPKIACKYISDVVTIRRDDLDAQVKVDLRFLVFLASVNPLRLYVYRPFSVRRGHKKYELTDFDDLLRHLTYVNSYGFNVYRPGMYTEEFYNQLEAENPDIKWTDIEEEIHTMLLETFQAAVSRPPPAGLADCPFSRAIYGIDLLLMWDKNEKGDRVVRPMLSEVNFTPDYTSWKENYPDMLNDAFSALFFDDIEGRESRVRRMAP